MTSASRATIWSPEETLSWQLAAADSPQNRTNRIKKRTRRRKRRSDVIEIERVEEPKTYVVEQDSGAHASLNLEFICYSGYESIFHDPYDSEIRAKALQAMEDMLERFDTDFPDGEASMPGAMGVQVIRKNKPAQGYEIHYHSSMRQKKKRSSNAIQLSDSFQTLMIQDDGTLPKHRRDYACTEPGLFTNSNSAHPGSLANSRVYFVDQYGDFLPSCKPDTADTQHIGCQHIVAAAKAWSISDGIASERAGNGTTVFWYDPFRINDEGASDIASLVASSILRDVANGFLTFPGAVAREDIIAQTARQMVLRIAPKINNLMAKTISKQERPDAPHQETANILGKAVPQLDPLAQWLTEDLVDISILDEIKQRVVSKVEYWVGGRMASKGKGPGAFGQTFITPYGADAEYLKELSRLY